MGPVRKSRLLALRRYDKLTIGSAASLTTPIRSNDHTAHGLPDLGGAEWPVGSYGYH